MSTLSLPGPLDQKELHACGIAGEFVTLFLGQAVNVANRTLAQGAKERDGYDGKQHHERESNCRPNRVSVAHRTYIFKARLVELRAHHKGAGDKDNYRLSRSTISFYDRPTPAARSLTGTYVAFDVIVVSVTAAHSCPWRWWMSGKCG